MLTPVISIQLELPPTSTGWGQLAVLTNGKQETNVEFRSLAQSGVEPPNPTSIRTHTAFAKLLNLCGAGQYLESVERDAPIPEGNFT